MLQRLFATAACLAAGALSGAENAPARPEITGPEEDTAPEGHFRLSWDGASGGPPETTFLVQQGRNPDFREPTTIYRGRDRSTYVSGLAEGDYFYRVRAKMAGAQSLWSETRHIRVDYVGDRQVVVMMLAGFVVFLATVLFIIAGHYRTRHQAIHPEHEDVPPHAG